MESTGPENPRTTPPPPPEQPPRRLTRSRTDRIVGGVCGGVARHYNLDPALVRIGFVAGVVLWGATAVLYLAALLLMPDESEGGAPAGGTGAPAGAGAAPAGDRNRVLTAIGIAALVIVGGPILLGLGLAAGGLLVPLALLALAGLGTAWLVTGRRPPSGDAAGLVRLTLLGLGVLALLFVLSVGSFWAAAAGGDAIVAGAVVAAGVALAVSAFARPARRLVLPALAVAIPAGFVAAAGVDLPGAVLLADSLGALDLTFAAFGPLVLAALGATLVAIGLSRRD